MRSVAVPLAFIPAILPYFYDNNQLNEYIYSQIRYPTIPSLKEMSLIHNARNPPNINDKEEILFRWRHQTLDTF